MSKIKKFRIIKYKNIEPNLKVKNISKSIDGKKNYTKFKFKYKYLDL